MADYLRLSSDRSMKAEEKFSLAASGWLLGSNAASTNLAVTLSLYQVRDLVRAYLNEPSRNKRDDLLRQLESLEGASPKQIAQILAHMKPPAETPSPEGGPPGLYALEVPGLDKQPDITYYVQLPPEYDPYRRYPTVVTLNGAGSSALQQIDWWAGAAGDHGQRQGQATRHGYIVVSVEWSKSGQRQYGYSAPEHYAVLASLRDACRRFSVDTDRVFLSGHSMGGDAAWDIGLAHPDLWAGVIPIVAVSDHYCAHYCDNAKLLPFYIVAGEKDGDKTKRNARDLDRYMLARYNVTLSEYQGRGHENFSDEIQRLFDWMGRFKRDFFPKEFKVSAMRTWDNFFWWVEVAEFPPRSVVEPSDWPPNSGYRAMKVEGKINGNNLFVTSGADKVAVYLSPEIVDFSKPIIVRSNGKTLNAGQGRLVDPSREVLLEDARTRADRLHPFWAKVE
jgi:predicted esterase